MRRTFRLSDGRRAAGGGRRATGDGRRAAGGWGLGAGGWVVIPRSEATRDLACRVRSPATSVAGLDPSLRSG